MGSQSASPRFRLSVLLAAITGMLLLLPAASAWADCTLPTNRGADNNDFLPQEPVGSDDVDPVATQTFKGHFGPDLNGEFIQIPFDVDQGTTGMRIRYCYSAGSTLDLGVYEPKSGGGNWTMDDLRGWSGSAVRAVGIGVNGYSDKTVYGEDGTTRKAYVPGRTTRAFKAGEDPDNAGELPHGKWAVELGAGWIDPDDPAGVDWRVEVVTSDEDGWADDRFVPEPYEPYTANPDPGWYQGDVHVHGEHEPGNATMKQTFDLAFLPNPPGNYDPLLGDWAPELDFVTLVDHNNINARSQLGASKYRYPGKLVIPGTEVTTYHGHYNSQNADRQADFRMSSIYRFDTGNCENGEDCDLGQGDPDLVRGPTDPAGQFGRIINDWGGWSQINHPEHFVNNPATCRGCAWGYSDARTDLSKVSAIEVQSGPAGLGFPLDDPKSMSAFTRPAIAFYEDALASGAHIAAVGSSDDHKAGQDIDSFAAPIGRATTVVHASELSQAAITRAVRDGHTWVKLFGPDAPDIEAVATVPGSAPALPGDSRAGKKMTLSLKVSGVDAVPRTGTWTLQVLRNGVTVDSTPITGDELEYSYSTGESGRYSFQLNRQYGSEEMIEGYSTPVWFTHRNPVSNRFAFRRLKLNPNRGTARLQVVVAGAGRVVLNGRGIARQLARSSARRRVVNLLIRPGGRLNRQLRRRGRARVGLKVAFVPRGGRPAVKRQVIMLKMRKPRRRSRRR